MRTMTALAIAVAIAGSVVTVHGAESEDAWKRVGETLGRAGELAQDGSYKVTILREDVAVKTASGMPVPAGLGLNSYAAFTGTPEDATVVGDTCLLEHEVNPEIDALRAGGLEVVAIHNHMLGDTPRLAFLHFQGRGNAVKLAGTIRQAWDLLGKVKPPATAPTAAAPEVDAAALARILKRPAPAAGGAVVKFTLPRTDLDIRLDGRKLVPGVGLACWAAFTGCPCGKTMVMGDTCVTRKELQSAIDALRRGGIQITGIHNHVLGQTGDVMFMHIEGEGDAAALAGTIRAAWDTLAISRASEGKRSSGRR
jgi:hypothetical protein